MSADKAAGLAGALVIGVLVLIIGIGGMVLRGQVRDAERLADRRAAALAEQRGELRREQFVNAQRGIALAAKNAELSAIRISHQVRTEWLEGARRQQSIREKMREELLANDQAHAQCDALPYPDDYNECLYGKGLCGAPGGADGGAGSGAERIH